MMSVDVANLARMREDEKLEEARRIVRNQASTAPKDGDLSAVGSLARATPGLRDGAGRPVDPLALARLAEAYAGRA
jgi:hypothetical protein